MADTKIYPKGIGTFAKSPKSPDFVLGTMVITLEDFFAWSKENESLKTEYNGKKQIKFQILQGRDGRINFPVDTWKPQPKDETISTEFMSPNGQEKPVDDDLPF